MSMIKIEIIAFDINGDTNKGTNKDTYKVDYLKDISKGKIIKRRVLD